MTGSPHDTSLDRRRFLRGGLATGAGALLLPPGLPNAAAAGEDLIESITTEVLWNGRSGAQTWFHPRPCRLPNQSGSSSVLMTLQSITGSDVFGPVHWTETSDAGLTWSDPVRIPAFGRRDVDSGLEEGVCDVVPQIHPPTRSILAMGHNVYYLRDRLARPSEMRWPVYSVRSLEGGAWSVARKLEWNDPRATAIYTCGCGQRLLLDGGDVLVPLSFGPLGRKHRSVTTAVCSFDGESLKVREVGRELINTAGRGLLEPSLARFGGRVFMTIRAEDDRGYLSASDDGLDWSDPRPWSWDDGEPLTMSTTQQHWVVHDEALFLVYTRKAERNVDVMRWRAPLYIARVDPDAMRLVRASERVVLPLIGDGVGDAKHVARMGNFHTLAASANESWVTVGETLPDDGWRGDVLLARIKWRRPNRALESL